MTVDWIAVDWGTSHLRVWGLSGTQVIHHAQSDQGAGALTPAQFEGAFLALANDWLPAGRVTPVLACGMVGSRQGWVEAPYRAVPCPPLHPSAPIRAPARDRRLSVHVIPGLKQSQPADVMRGEETQIAGFLAHNPGWDGVICLPGTHSKWAYVSAGSVTGFQTFMTGELFGLLSERSVLRHGLEGWDDAAFQPAVDAVMAHPEQFAARLFSLRAEGLLQGLDPAMALARLSGLLIGAELAAARPCWLDQRVAIIGPSSLSRLYAAALEALSVPTTTHGVTDLTLAGLAQVRAQLTHDTGDKTCAH